MVCSLLLCYIFSLHSTNSTTTGVVQYYTCKPVPIAQELLVFYGDEYFLELGYEIFRDDGETTGFFLGVVLKILYSR